LTSYLIYHIASGHAFFSGIVAVIAAAFLLRLGRAWMKRVAVVIAICGFIAIALSSTPLPYWCYAVALLATLVWMASAFRQKWQLWSPYVLTGAWLFAAAIEAPYHFMPSLPSAPRRITIIGDSVSASASGGRENAWPALLSRTYGIEVQDLSHVADTTKIAIKRARSQPLTGDTLLVEIGGNDLLGSSSAEEYRASLDALLAFVTSPGRQVVMFELPLLPFYHNFGRIQRTVAWKHGVQLIPKRVFLAVLTGNNATLDSIHLSRAGHRRMAGVVWAILGRSPQAPE